MPTIDMPKFTFDGENKLFILKPGITTFDAIIDLYSDWKEMLLAEDAKKFEQALRVTGGDDLPGGQTISGYIFLVNGYRIRPDEDDYSVLAVGDLFVDEGGSAFIPTLGSFNVLVELRTSSKSITSILVDWTQVEKDALLADMDTIKKFEEGRWKLDILANTMTFYDTDGLTPLKVFDMKDKDGNPATERVFERVPQP